MLEFLHLFPIRELRGYPSPHLDNLLETFAIAATLIIRIIGSETERTILHEQGQGAAAAR
jgi:hypothetical protein